MDNSFPTGYSYMFDQLVISHQFSHMILVKYNGFMMIGGMANNIELLKKLTVHG